MSAASGLGDTDGADAKADQGMPADQGGEGAAIGDDEGGPVTVTNVARAIWAAAMAYGPGGFGWSWAFITSDMSNAQAAAAEAAAFLRQWPDASAEAITIHLRMKGFRDVPQPGPRELAAWKVFGFTLACLDDVDRQEAEAKAAEEAKAAAAVPSAGLPLDQALMPEPGPFDASSGFSPRR